MSEYSPFFYADGIDFKKLNPLEKEAYRQIKDTTEKFVSFLQNNEAKIRKLSIDEIDNHKQNWFSKVVPDDKKQKALDCYCFDKDGCSGYLWYVFSFELMDCLKGNDAKSAFDSTPKQDAILLSNWPLGILSCEIKNAASIKADRLDDLIDLIITDCNFEWTYVKTHESECGPYFYSIRSK